ncbi:MAG: transposase, partial [Limnospira sp. PMC 1234.20]|uniref:transposase n=1 Tax=Limnospira sp. PMC 1234.20 TaxID=2981032 RepID=UPI0028E0CACB
TEKDAVIAKLGGDLEKLRHQFDLMLKKMFGRSSEKLDPNQLLMDALMLQAQDTFAEAVPDVPVAQAAPAVAAAPVSKRNGRTPIAEHLKRNDIIIDVPESE